MSFRRDEVWFCVVKTTHDECLPDLRAAGAGPFLPILPLANSHLHELTLAIRSFAQRRIWGAGVGSPRPEAASAQSAWIAMTTFQELRFDRGWRGNRRAAYPQLLRCARVRVALGDIEAVSVRSGDGRRGAAIIARFFSCAIRRAESSRLGKNLQPVPAERSHDPDDRGPGLGQNAARTGRRGKPEHHAVRWIPA